MEKKTAFKDLSRKAKVQYIWDYYRWHIVVAICFVAFVISNISRTFASRLLSNVYKELILIVLIVLCPRTVRNAGKNCFLVVNI